MNFSRKISAVTKLPTDKFASDDARDAVAAGVWDGVGSESRQCTEVALRDVMEELVFDIDFL